MTHTESQVILIPAFLLPAALKTQPPVTPHSSRIQVHIKPGPTPSTPHTLCRHINQETGAIVLLEHLPDGHLRLTIEHE